MAAAVCISLRHGLSEVLQKPGFVDNFLHQVSKNFKHREIHHKSKSVMLQESMVAKTLVFKWVLGEVSIVMNF